MPFTIQVCQFVYSLWQGAPDTTSYDKVCQRHMKVNRFLRVVWFALLLKLTPPYTSRGRPFNMKEGDYIFFFPSPKFLEKKLNDMKDVKYIYIKSDICSFPLEILVTLKKKY